MKKLFFLFTVIFLSDFIFADSHENFDAVKADFVERFTSCIYTTEKNDYGIKLSFNDFKTIGIWTPNHVNANFVCLEPWLGCADSPTSSGKFTEKKDIINLESNKTFTTSYQITILK